MPRHHHWVLLPTLVAFACEDTSPGSAPPDAHSAATLPNAEAIASISPQGLRPSDREGDPSVPKQAPSTDFWNAIKDGRPNVVEEESKRGIDVESTTTFALRPDEALGQKEPARWLKAYLKYKQLLGTPLYSEDPALCPRARTSPGPSLKPIKNPKALLDQAKKELNGLAAEAKLLTRSASLSVNPLRGVRPLHLAAMFCEASTARRLVERGANVNSKDLLGLTPLHYATCAPVAELLIEKGARVDASNGQGLTPLHLASDRGVAISLIRASAAVNGRDRCGNTPLHLAMYSGQGPTVEPSATSEAGAGTESNAGTSHSPILASLVRLGNFAADVIEDVVRSRQVGDVLLAHGADPSLVNAAGHSATVVGEKSRERTDLDD